MLLRLLLLLLGGILIHLLIWIPIVCIFNRIRRLNFREHPMYFFVAEFMWQLTDIMAFSVSHIMFQQVDIISVQVLLRLGFHMHWLLGSQLRCRL